LARPVAPSSWGLPSPAAMLRGAVGRRLPRSLRQTTSTSGWRGLPTFVAAATALAATARGKKSDPTKQGHMITPSVGSPSLQRGRKLPLLPEEVRPYKRGEGYGSNVIRFNGTVIRRGQTGRRQAKQMVLRAMEIDKRLRRHPGESAAIPVPVERLERESSLRKVLGELKRRGCSVIFDDFDVSESHGSSWAWVHLQGDARSVQAGTLEITAAIALASPSASSIAASLPGAVAVDDASG